MKTYQFLTTILLFLIITNLTAQIGINSSRGLLIPIMTNAQRDGISAAATGLMIFQTDGAAGFYFYNGSGWTVLSATYTVNTFYAELGGYVIEVNSDGTHGLVVARKDQGTSSWYGANDLLSDADNHDTDGSEFKDWRMPTKRELNLAYNQKSNIGGFANSSYYCSTEYNVEYTWGQNFSDGQQYQYYRKAQNYSAKVRAVRTF